MAITQSNSGLDVILDAGRTFFHQTRDQMQKAHAKRKIYHATLHELSVLTNRDLRDLGVQRSNIKRLAMEAAYGR